MDARLREALEALLDAAPEALLFEVGEALNAALGSGRSWLEIEGTNPDLAGVADLLLQGYLEAGSGPPVPCASIDPTPEELEAIEVRYAGSGYEWRVPGRGWSLGVCASRLTARRAAVILLRDRRRAIAAVTRRAAR